MEDLGLALNAQGMGAVADLGNVDVAGSHGGDLLGAALELGQGDVQAHLLKVAHVQSGGQQAVGTHVGHVGNAQVNGLELLGGLGSRGGSGSGLGSRGGSRGAAGGAAAGGQAQGHNACQREAEKLFHMYLPPLFLKRRAMTRLAWPKKKTPFPAVVISKYTRRKGH